MVRASRRRARTIKVLELQLGEAVQGCIGRVLRGEEEEIESRIPSAAHMGQDVVEEDRGTVTR